MAAEKTMSIDAAAARTYEVAEHLQRQGHWRASDCPEMAFAHIMGMWDQWSDDMSDEKKCRWLGWMQATIVAMTYPKANLLGMKMLNRDYL